MAIEDLIHNLSKDPFDPLMNFWVAEEYHQNNQSASAVSFYLRCAEYGHHSYPDYVYASLLKLALCFNDQKDRNHTVTNAVLQAIAYRPSRQEAYFLLSQFHERAGNWQECYTFAVLGLWQPDRPALPTDVGYHGRFCLTFERAVSAYWIGRKDESIDLFHALNKQDLPPDYRQAVLANMERLNVAI